MKKRYFLPIIPVLFAIASSAFPAGWPMPSETFQFWARVIFWVSIGAIPIVSFIAYWDFFNKWIPIIHFGRRGVFRRMDDAILRQITHLNASPLKSDGSEIVHITAIFPAFITKKLEFAKVRGCLSVDGYRTEEEEFRPFTLFENSPNEIQLPIHLGAKVSARIKENEFNNQLKVTLHLTGWDAKNRKYDLSTREWTTRPLT